MSATDRAEAGPTPDEESAPFWAGLAEHRLRLQRCTRCGRTRFPPLPSCPWCAADGPKWIDAGGTGTIYSWVTVHRPVGDNRSADVPYTIGAVTLDEGCRVFARVDAPLGAVDAGMAVVAHYVDHGSWTELRFIPSGSR